MTTWANFLSELRTDLKDTSATPKYSDALLYMYTRDAVRDYSTWFPQRIDAAQLTVADSKYALPSNYIEDIHAESPLGTFLEKRPSRPGTLFPTRSTNFYYYIQGGYLYVSDPGDVIYLTYFATHDLPASETDTTFVFTVPDADMELIRLYVKAKIYEYIRGRQAALDRFKLKGTRDDNPIEPEVDNLMGEYKMKIAERAGGGVVMLFRRGHRR